MEGAGGEAPIDALLPLWQAGSTAKTNMTDMDPISALSALGRHAHI